jgi:His/Glu/Gln/Arg/opine family amino acid ABC transporter permease subunit
MSDTHAETAGIGYVRTVDAPLMAPPASQVGWQGWLRQNVLNSVSDFSSVGAALSSILMLLVTAGVLYFGLTILWELIRFTLIDAVWSDPDGLKRGVCLTVDQNPPGPHATDWSGACWPFVDAKWKAYTYGRYPESELWRPDLVFLLGSVGAAWLVSDAITRRWFWGVVMIAAGAALFWWSTQPIENDGVALLNDVYDPAMASPLGQFFDRTPIGAWILCAVGALYILLVRPFARKAVAIFMLTVFPVIAYVLLTGGDAEGGVGFWITLAVIAGFGLLLWLIGKLFGDNAFSALLLSAMVLIAALYFLWNVFEPTTGFGLTDDGIGRTGQGSVIRLPIPVGATDLLLAGIGFLSVLFLMMSGRIIGMMMRLLLAVPVLLMIGRAYSSEVGSISLPVGWLIFALLLIGVVGFAMMAFVGMGRREWHSAIGNFGRGTGRMIFVCALIVGVVAFIGGHWFVDLIELAAAGEADKFLSAGHLAAHDEHGLLGLTAEPMGEIERHLWVLPEVETNVWGGLLVTLVVSFVGIIASLPLGILLALGRRSQLPAVRILSTVFIEFWRGIPLITVLFMSSVMLPLFLPDGVEFNKLLRALIGVALFASAYMAEVVRGGLQAIPKGQYEGADSLGLGYTQKMRLIVMPQALTLVIPGIVNTFIGLFKDTVLVLIIGLFDLLGMVQTSFTDPSWSTPVTGSTGYLVAAGIFFIFCFGMSRYSMFMERRLRRGHAR